MLTFLSKNQTAIQHGYQIISADTPSYDICDCLTIGDNLFIGKISVKQVA